ncbi:hypothetical protein OG394_24565 [Kribbella sp. NBC_01245]|uniref:hypothetical protein n=1 Tax=Kribbella sp. NBC_01245 TaxID=2903578 RepID=UPI002E29CF09|nr:hypothetical protein [Kribbella sp. NBC_01245]
MRGWNLAFALTLWAYLLLVAPWLAHRSHRRLVKVLAAGDANARIRQYTTSAARNVAIAAVAVALVVSSDGGHVEYLGLRWPTHAGYLSAALVVSLSAVILARFLQVRRSGTITVVSGDKVRPYQPVTTLERVVYGVTLLVNGLTRQLVFAGFLAVTVVTLGPESSAWFAIGVAAIVVAVNQSWLRWSCIPMAALGGALSMYLFLATRSILLSVAIFVIAGAQGYIAPVSNVRSKARSRWDGQATSP